MKFGTCRPILRLSQTSIRRSDSGSRAIARVRRKSAMLSIGALLSASRRVARSGRVAVSGALNRPRNSAFSPLSPSCGQSRSTTMLATLCGGVRTDAARAA